MDYSFLTRTSLFKGIPEEDIVAILTCLDAKQKSYAKGDCLYQIGSQATALGLVLSGSVHVESVDVWGNTTILASVDPGQVFAEAYACLPGEPLMINVVAVENCEVLLIEMGCLLNTCPNTCSHHRAMLSNFMTVLARKNLELSRRSLHVSSKTIRDKVLSYLSYQVTQQGSTHVTISFNRQQLANYLSVDRSALSNELSKMQEEGLLTVDKNHFSLLP